MTITTYYFESDTAYSHAIVVDTESNRAHIYDDIYEDTIGSWWDDDWECSLEEARKWYKKFRQNGEPLVLEGNPMAEA